MYYYFQNYRVTCTASRMQLGMGIFRIKVEHDNKGKINNCGNWYSL